MDENSATYNALYAALGQVVYEWAWLEDDVASLIIALTNVQSKHLMQDQGFGKFLLAVDANVDLRTNIQIAKALTRYVETDTDFRGRADKTLNFIGNELRNDRNRYIHDLWYVAGERFMRLKKGTTVKRVKGSGEVKVDLRSITEFQTLGDVKALVTRIQKERRNLGILHGELGDLFTYLYGDEEGPPPTP
ncbi:hypothetical protein K3179_09760 [Qipengyuania sp. GH38]|uniref:hypothetical protein n=1 Tax=Qipengyuania intermedia TaxID=2867244 RepID=UPI001C875F8B|nr:hypothetical protein [Qipengyuania intermedia]MBX7514828.1 hypothetical protein [Qipengyuania intermedia]